MKKTLLLFLLALLMLFSNSYAQNTLTLTDIAQQKNEKGWIQFLPKMNLTPQQVFSVYKDAFGLQQMTKCILIRNETD